jgi:predicted ester cyclase
VPHEQAVSTYIVLIASAHAIVFSKGGTLVVSESNASVVRRYVEMWNTGNVEWANELLALTWHDHAHPEITNLEQVKEILSKTRAAFPDFHITIEMILSDADLVALRALIQAGKPSRVMWFVRVVGGQMHEMWTGTESLDA